MILIVGDKETYQLVVLAVLALDEREHQAAILVAGIFHLDGGGAVVLEPSIGYRQTIGNRHGDFIAFLESGGVEIACTEIDTHHIVEAIFVFGLLPEVVAATGLLMHLDVTVAIGIGVTYLIDIVSLAFPSSLTIVNRGNIVICIAQEGITHDEHVIELAIASCGQTATVTVLTFVIGVDGGHGCGTDFPPDELPIEIEVVTYELACGESCVIDAALCLGGGECLQEQTE